MHELSGASGGGHQFFKAIGAVAYGLWEEPQRWSCSKCKTSHIEEVNLRGDNWRFKRGCDEPAERELFEYPDGTKFFRCPHSLHASYTRAFLAYCDFKTLGLLQYGARDINDLPHWLVECFRIFESCRAEAEHQHSMKTEREMQAKLREIRKK